jgi:hypothetical protein
MPTGKKSSSARRNSKMHNLVSKKGEDQSNVMKNENKIVIKSPNYKDLLRDENRLTEFRNMIAERKRQRPDDQPFDLKEF